MCIRDSYGTAVLHPEKSVDAEFKDTFQRIAKNTNRFVTLLLLCMARNPLCC